MRTLLVLLALLLAASAPGESARPLRLQLPYDVELDAGAFVSVVGPSGCGKSTLLNHMVGLRAPAAGDVLYDGESFWHAEDEERDRLRRRLGVSYQAGALWSSMTLAENVGLALEAYTELTAAEIREVAALKLALVGLRGFEEYYPNELSGGMQKRAGLARAMALDPEILFFDEPSAGLDPISSRLLDDLILELRASLKATIVVVTHDEGLAKAARRVVHMRDGAIVDDRRQAR